MHCLESFSLLTRYVSTMRKSICQDPTQEDVKGEDAFQRKNKSRRASPQGTHGQRKTKILKQRNKTNSRKSQMLRHAIHDHTLHKTLHQIYVVLSETGTQSKKVCAPNKSLRKTFGEKEGNIQTRSEFSKIPTELDLKSF